MSLFQDIRGALTARANSTSGMPTSRAYEGVHFDPTVGTAYVSYALLPSNERPSTIGPYGFTLRQGLFQISLFYPSKSGTGTAEAQADAVKDNFVPGTTLTQNTTDVVVRYAERGPAQIDADWIMIPVTVGWQTHTPTTP